MHTVARHLAKKFESKAPPSFDKCFKYNYCYYTSYNGEPATIEEYVPGTFVKIVDNDMASVQNHQKEQVISARKCLPRHNAWYIIPINHLRSS